MFSIALVCLFSVLHKKIGTDIKGKMENVLRNMTVSEVIWSGRGGHAWTKVCALLALLILLCTLEAHHWNAPVLFLPVMGKSLPKS